MKTLYKLFSILIILALSFSGCKNYAVTTAKDPTCRTIISGVMHHSPYTFQTPAIIMENEKDYMVFNGKIIEKTNEGYIFTAINKSKTNESITGLFKFNDILCLVDSTDKVIYGSVPKELIRNLNVEIALIPENQPDKSPLMLELKENKPFSYCIDPGSYKVDYIEYSLSGKSTIKTKKHPEMNIKIESEINNYIGDIFFKEKIIKKDDWIYIPSEALTGNSEDFKSIFINALNNSMRERTDIFIMVLNELPPGDTRTVSLMTISNIEDKK